jgi:PAS domain S-box-containing protein
MRVESVSRSGPRPRQGPSASVGPEQLQALIDHTNAVIYMRDLDGRYLVVNREYERLFHMRREEIVGLTDHDLFPAEIADEFRANDLRAASGGGPVHVEEVAPGADGPHTYITVKFPLLDSAGQPYAVCGISTDITARKRAEEQVRQLNAELEQRVRDRTAELEATARELDAFAYSVSHDLRAPLRSLHGFSEVLLEDYADRLDDEGRQYLQRIQANVARMGQLIDDLLRLSRASRTGLKRERVDIGAQASEIIAGLRGTAPGRRVEVVIADALVTTGDSRLIRLALENLLSNAWKFTGRREHAIIGVGTVGQPGGQAFFVRDNGAGFDMRYAGKLFDPFQRLHPAAEFEGSGIGLAIVHRILSRHGGRIWAESEPGKGSTFFFTLTPDGPDRSDGHEQ